VCQPPGVATFADRIQELINDRRISQHAFADLVGVTQPAVAGWRSGAIPYARTVNRICAMCGVRRAWLLYGEGEKEAPRAAKGRASEEPAEYNRREKITFIEEQAPELLPLVDAFLDSVQRQHGAGLASKPQKKTREASR